MPRRGPINPEGYYHVSTKGNFGQPLFRTPAEHALYLELYGRFARKFKWQTLAWSLLCNHHHFLIKLNDGGLSEGMRAINHGFSCRMNAVYGRTGSGHLVKHCFFANEVVDEPYFLTVCRYIELNAVAANQCRRPEDWPWCGYAATLGLVQPRPFHDVRALLRHFADAPEPARDAYRRLVTDAASVPSGPDPMPGTGYGSVTPRAAALG